MSHRGVKYKYASNPRPSMMKHLLAIAMLMLIVVSCGPTQEAAPVQAPAPQAAPAQPSAPTTVEKAPSASPTTEPSTVVVEKQPTAAPKEVPPAPTTTVAPTYPSEMTPEVKALLEKADAKVKSYGYTLASPPDQLARDAWKIKGSKIRIELFEDNYVEADTNFDTIFIDTATKTAVGACLSQRTTRCAQRNKQFDLDYDDVIKKTPYQWLKEIPTAPKLVSTELIYDRKASVVEYLKDGQKITLWIDQFSGLPVRTQVGEDRKSRYEFRYLELNSMSDELVTLPTK